MNKQLTTMFIAVAIGTVSFSSACDTIEENINYSTKGDTYTRKLLQALFSQESSNDHGDSIDDFSDTFERLYYKKVYKIKRYKKRTPRRK